MTVVTGPDQSSDSICEHKVQNSIDVWDIKLLKIV